MIKKKFLFILIIIIILCASYYFSIYQPNKLVEKYKELALEALTKFDFTTSLKYHEKILEINPDNYLVMAELAIDYEMTGNPEKAIELLEIALKGFSSEEKVEYVRFYTNLASLYSNFGYIDKSIEVYKKAIEIAPNDYLAYLNIGGILFHTGKQDEGIYYEKKALELKPGDTNILKNLGYMYFKIDFEKAKYYYEKYIEINKTNHYIYSTLGNLYAYYGYIDKAKKYYLESLKLGPEDYDNNFAYGAFLFDNNESKESLAYLLKAYNFNPKEYSLNFMIGTIYYKMGNYNKAVEYLNKAKEYGKHLENKGDYIEIFSLLGTCYYLLNDYNTSLKYYYQYLEDTTEKKINEYNVRSNIKKIEKELSNIKTDK